MASSSFTNSKYDVFLNFRGIDTRRTFTSHLEFALRSRGIRTFIDGQLDRGKVISSALLEIIESSRMSILVFSSDYASSTYCLDELVKILECQKLKGQIVVPIFYDVNPEEVEQQSGRYGEALTRHESMEDVEKVKDWKAALSKATSFAGWHLNYGNEADFIRNIVEDVHKKLNKKVLHVADSPVGIDYQMKILSHKLSVGSNDVRMVGICGTGGIGKTTIAKATFNKFANQFEGSCFLANVRETSKRYSVAQLQETLLFEILGHKEVLSRNYDRGISLLKDMLCRKQVFIVIDDVDDVDQLKKLAGQLDWFGSGSRVVITTRDEHLLDVHGVQTVYKVKGLYYEDALQLFSWNAFKKHQPEENYAELSSHVLKYVNGLPLALIVLGSHLYGRGLREWESCLAKWKRNPPKEIFDILKISFDALEDNEKAIFLDIACFFKWTNLDYVSKILEACDFEPDIGVQILIEKSLISIEYGTLQMHDLIQSMGWQIVHQESPTTPCERSRLWFHEDVFHVLTENMGTHKIEAIMLDLRKEEEEIDLPIEAFSMMKKLRILIIRNAHITGVPKSLPNELRWLDWPGCPLETLPSTFQARKLVALNMPNSLIKHIGAGFKNFRSLKYMNFRYCQFLEQFPDFSTIQNLEKLDFEGCRSLVKIHPSIGSLQKLEMLNFRFCSNLESIPSCFKPRSLQFLYLTGCSKLEELPNTMEYMACLQVLDLERTAVKELPSSIEFLSKLQQLRMSSCRNLTSLPSGIYNLDSLWELHINNCSQLNKFPETTEEITRKQSWNYRLEIRYCSLSDLEFLKRFDFSWLSYLDLSGNNFVSIPSCISKFTYLREIHLSKCPRLREIPELPSSIQKVEARDCKSLERFSQLTHIFQFNNTERLAEVYILDFSNCHKLAHNQGKNFEMPPSYLDNRSFLQESSVLLPGNGIPSWFHYQSEGDSLSFQMPSSPFYRKIEALLLCLVIASDAVEQPIVSPEIFVNGRRVDTHRGLPRSLVANFFGRCAFDSDHLGLINFPIKFSRDLPWLKDSSFPAVSFEIRFVAINATVKRCGSHPVLNQECFYLPEVSNLSVSSNCDSESSENEFGVSLASSLQPSIPNGQDSLGIQELVDVLDDVWDSNGEVGRKKMSLTDETEPSTGENEFLALSLALPLQPTVKVTQDPLGIEELEDMHTELYGQTQRESMRMIDQEHAMALINNEHVFDPSLALSLRPTLLITQDPVEIEQLEDPQEQQPVEIENLVMGLRFLPL